MEEKVAYQSYERARDIQVQPGPDRGEGDRGEGPGVQTELTAAIGGGFYQAAPFIHVPICPSQLNSRNSQLGVGQR